jgi:hypothetical protein
VSQGKRIFSANDRNEAAITSAPDLLLPHALNNCLSEIHTADVHGVEFTV